MAVVDQNKRGLTLFIATGKNRNGSYFVPSSLDSATNEVGVAAKFARPFDARKSFSVMRDQERRPSVVRLLLTCRPSAVIGAIMPRIIDSVDRVIWGWPMAHILEKHLETILPPMADGNASASVKVVVVGFWVRASSPHRLPRFIFRGSTHPVDWLHAAFFHASARLREASGYVAAHGRKCFSAITKAMPHSSFGFAGYTGNNNNFAEALAREVDKVWHGVSPFGVSLNITHGTIK